MNGNRVPRRAAAAIERATRALRFRGKTGGAEISTAPSRAILAHPGKEFLPMTAALRRTQPIAGAQCIVVREPSLPPRRTGRRGKLSQRSSSLIQPEILSNQTEPALRAIAAM